MGDRKMKNQVIENKQKRQIPDGKSTGNPGYFSGGRRCVACVVCSSDFQPRNSRHVTCSQECGRALRLRYAADYRQQGREIRDKVLEMLGGRRPTKEDFLNLVRQRREKP